jgi:hypothetical protein
MYSGLQLDIKLRDDIPPAIIVWLSKHTLGDGNIPEINDLFSSGVPYFENWKGGSLVFKEDHWHLKSNGVGSRYDDNKLAFFLHELQPWMVVDEGRVLARLVYEESETTEEIFWIDPIDTLVRRRRATRYGWGGSDSILGVDAEPEDRPGFSTDHPKTWDAEDLAKSLGHEHNYPQPAFLDWKVFNFPVNPKVNVKAETKRILAKQHNDGHVTNVLAEIAKMEGKTKE